MKEIVKGLYAHYKITTSDDVYRHMIYGDINSVTIKEIREEFAKHSSAGIDRVKQRLKFDSDTRDDIFFIKVSTKFCGYIREIHTASRFAEVDKVKRCMNKLKDPSCNLYFVYIQDPKDTEQFSNEDIDRLMKSIDTQTASLADINMPDEFEECAKIIQNELTPFVSQAAADMIQYNITLMKAYDEVAKRHGLI